MEIVRAHPQEADTLTAIAFAAKGHWGYPSAWLEQWRGQLTVTSEYIAANSSFVAVEAGERIGFVVVDPRGMVANLEHLWILPAAMSRGVGRALFAAAETAALESGASELRIVSDPHAEGFYRRMGAELSDWEAAAMDGQNRLLPVLSKRLRA